MVFFVKNLACDLGGSIHNQSAKLLFQLCSQLIPLGSGRFLGLGDNVSGLCTGLLGLLFAKSYSTFFSFFDKALSLLVGFFNGLPGAFLACSDLAFYLSKLGLPIRDPLFPLLKHLKDRSVGKFTQDQTNDEKVDELA